MLSDEKPSKTPYHDHLDVCRWCGEHPFNLCPAGKKAIEAEARMMPDYVADGTRWPNRR